MIQIYKQQLHPDKISFRSETDGNISLSKHNDNVCFSVSDGLKRILTLPGCYETHVGEIS